MYDLVIKNGQLHLSRSLIKADLAVMGERIAAIGTGFHGKEEIDARGMYVLPGVIDPHTHINLDMGGTITSDNFYNGTVAAAAGGITTIIDFTNSSSPHRTIPDDINARLQSASESVIDFGFHAEVTGWLPGDEWQIRKAIEMGVSSFKFFTTYSDSGRRSDSDVLYHAFREIADMRALALVHCEDDDLIKGILNRMTSQDLSRMSKFSYSRPSAAEASSIAQVIFYAKMTGSNLHIVHVSSSLGIEELRRGQSEGVSVTGETCPQYLLLDNSLYETDHGYLYSIAPPLRETEDRYSLWDAISKGTLSFVASDHCQYRKEQKEWQGSFPRLPKGLPGTETMLPLIFSEGVMKNRLPLEDLAKILSENAAKVYGLFPQKGILGIGSDADLVIFDPSAEWTIHASDLHMKTDFSPYEGLTVQGKAIATISRGELIFYKGEFIGNMGRGNFLKRKTGLSTH